jgi:histone-lysine N-methyltransferase EZH2
MLYWPSPSSKWQERSEVLFEKNEKHSGTSDKIQRQLSLDKTMDAILDSFDNLFCRRCLVSFNFWSSIAFTPCCQIYVLPIGSTKLARLRFTRYVYFTQVFDCRLHGCSQNLVFPVSNWPFTFAFAFAISISPLLSIWKYFACQCEKQPYSFEHDENKKPCGDQCYLRVRLMKFSTILTIPSGSKYFLF